MEEHICAVCRVALDTLEEDGTSRWIHPLGQRDIPGVFDHAPVPVPRSSGLESRGVCDFCRGPADWRFPCESFVVMDGTGSEGDWAACTPCKIAVESRDIGKLVYRATHGETPVGVLYRSTLRRAHREELETFLRSMYRQVFAHRRGDPVRIV